jgi:hypothetical protein
MFLEIQIRIDPVEWTNINKIDDPVYLTIIGSDRF